VHQLVNELSYDNIKMHGTNVNEMQWLFSRFYYEIILLAHKDRNIPELLEIRRFWVRRGGCA